MFVKKVDSKGRVLIPELSGSQVVVEAISENEFRVKRVEVIPAEEAWLYKNPKALAMVRRGLEQAARGEFVDDPMEGKDYSWLDEIDEE